MSGAVNGCHIAREAQTALSTASVLSALTLCRGCQRQTSIGSLLAVGQTSPLQAGGMDDGISGLTRPLLDLLPWHQARQSRAHNTSQMCPILAHLHGQCKANRVETHSQRGLDSGPGFNLGSASSRAF